MDAQDRTIGTGASRPPLAMRPWLWLRRIAPALGVFFLAPLMAEYLIGYDSSTGDFAVLLAGLMVLAPLYGGPALLIREVARRTGRGWPTMILLAFGFGLLQAGLIDHSLFNLSYRDIDYWQDQLAPTYIPALGIVVDPTIDFILGHVIWSFCIPIAIVETLVLRRSTMPWLGKPGLILTSVLYILAAVLIFTDHVESEQFLPSTPQLIGAVLAVVAFFVAAFIAGRRPRPPVDRPAPNPWLVGAVAFAVLNLSFIIEIVFALLEIGVTIDASWWDVALTVVPLGGLAIVVARWSRWAGWGAAHRLALAGAALLTRAWLAFLVQPLGDVALYDKLIHNAVFALGGLILLGAAARAARKRGG
jgi:hypothetical protein